MYMTLMIIALVFLFIGVTELIVNAMDAIETKVEHYGKKRLHMHKLNRSAHLYANKWK